MTLTERAALAKTFAYHKVPDIKGKMVLVAALLFLGSCVPAGKMKNTTKIRTNTRTRLSVANGKVKRTRPSKKNKVTTMGLNTAAVLTLTTDSISKTVVVPKKFGLPQNAYINMADTASTFYPKNPTTDRRGQTFLHVSLPHINFFQLHPSHEAEKKVNAGFWGLTLGADHYYAPQRYISLSATGAADFFVPIPAAIDIRGSYPLMSTAYLSLSHSHRLGNFHFGYGLSLARNTWDLRFYPHSDSLGYPVLPQVAPVKRTDNAIGAVFPFYYQTGYCFSFGMVYRPTFYRPGADIPFRYEHLISIDLACKVRVHKPRQVHYVY